MLTKLLRWVLPDTLDVFPMHMRPAYLDRDLFYAFLLGRGVQHRLYRESDL